MNRYTDKQKHAVVREYFAAGNANDKAAALARNGCPSEPSVYLWRKLGFGLNPDTLETGSVTRAVVQLLRKAEADKVITGEQAWRLRDLYTSIEAAR